MRVKGLGRAEPAARPADRPPERETLAVGAIRPVVDDRTARVSAPSRSPCMTCVMRRRKRPRIGAGVRRVRAGVRIPAPVADPGLICGKGLMGVGAILDD